MNSQLPRRSMSQALQTADLPPEALALIKEGTPQPKVARPIIAPSVPSVEAPIYQADAAIEVTREEAAPREKDAEEKTARVRQPKEKEAEAGNAGTISRSFRLPGNLPTALLRASTERRITRTKPFTQEEIVAEALTQWLKKNGHLS